MVRLLYEIGGHTRTPKQHFGFSDGVMTPEQAKAELLRAHNNPIPQGPETRFTSVIPLHWYTPGVNRPVPGLAVGMFDIADQKNKPTDPGIREVALSSVGSNIPISFGKRRIFGNILDSTALTPRMIGTYDYTVDYEIPYIENADCGGTTDSEDLPEEAEDPCLPRITPKNPEEEPKAPAVVATPAPPPLDDAILLIALCTGGYTEFTAGDDFPAGQQQAYILNAARPAHRMNQFYKNQPYGTGDQVLGLWGVGTGWAEVIMTPPNHISYYTGWVGETLHHEDGRWIQYPSSVAALMPYASDLIESARTNGIGHAHGNVTSEGVGYAYIPGASGRITLIDSECSVFMLTAVRLAPNPFGGSFRQDETEVSYFASASTAGVLYEPDTPKLLKGMCGLIVGGNLVSSADGGSNSGGGFNFGVNLVDQSVTAVQA